MDLPQARHENIHRRPMPVIVALHILPGRVDSHEGIGRLRLRHPLGQARIHAQIDPRIQIPYKLLPFLRPRAVEP